MLVEVVVDDQRVGAAGHGPAAGQCGKRASAVDRAPPATQQRLHALADRWIVVDHPDPRTGQRCQARHRWCLDLGYRTPGVGHQDREARAVPRGGGQRQPMAEHAADAVDDGQPQPQAAVALQAAGVAAAELEEDLLALGLLDTAAGIGNADFEPLPAAPAAEQDATARRIANGVAEQVAHYPRQQRQVGIDHRRAGHIAQHQAAGRGHLAVLLGQRIEQLGGGERRHIRRQHAGIESRDIHQRAEQRLDVLQRAADMPHQPPRLRRQRWVLELIPQGGGKQARRVERLQQVVADRGQKLALREVGRLGLGLGLAQPPLGLAAHGDLLAQLGVHRPQLGVDLAQLIEGTMQGLGALADLLGQQHSVLEGRIGRTAGDTAGLDALDQRRTHLVQPRILLDQGLLAGRQRGIAVSRYRGAQAQPR